MGRIWKRTLNKWAYESEVLIQLVPWRTPVSMARFPQEPFHFLSSWATVSLKSRILLQGDSVLLSIKAFTLANRETRYWQSKQRDLIEPGRRLCYCGLLFPCHESRHRHHQYSSTWMTSTATLKRWAKLLNEARRKVALSSYTISSYLHSTWWFREWQVLTSQWAGPPGCNFAWFLSK